MTEDDVNAWLAAHHPEIARDFARQQQRLEEARRTECPYVCNAEGRCLLDEILVGVPVAELIAPHGGHWAFELFPGCGAFEICQLAARVLTPGEAAALSLTFALGLSPDRAALEQGVHRSSLFRRLVSARRKIGAARREGRLPMPDDERDGFDHWRALQSAAPTVYHRPCRRKARAAYVCDCGRHLRLTTAFLDHRRLDPTLSVARKSKAIRERILNCPCGRKYPEGEWGRIAA